MPRGVVWPDVGDEVLLVHLEPSPQDVELWGSSDKVPALGGLLNTAVEAEEQEDVAAANALFVQVPLRDAGLAEHSSPLLPGGTGFPVPVRVGVEVGVEMDLVPSVHAAAGDAADDAGNVDVAVLKVIERFFVVGGYRQRKHRAVGKDGAGTAA